MSDHVKLRTDPNITPPLVRVPECPRGCGFTGWPDGNSSPYLGCGGDPARHQRKPVAAEFHTPPAPQPESPFTPAPPKPRKQSPRPSYRGAGTTPWKPTSVKPGPPISARGRCGTCNRDIALLAGPDGPIVWEHRYLGNRCGGSGHPPRATAGAR